MFSQVQTRGYDPAADEDRVLAFWNAHDTFAKSLAWRRGQEEYVFYDGPPFATGLPHYGHLLAGTIKDVVPRYQTMCGYYVDRVFGWDCHGLPVENEVEKELGIESKHEIEDYGVDRFNETCRSIVLRYTSEWERLVPRMGRWVDFENGYRTMDRTYMESIWWVFRRLWDKDLVYEGHKIMWYCPRCATPLSNFEVSDAYLEVADPAITVRLASVDEPQTYFLAWTTTPWTLPSNLALVVGEDIEYVTVQDGADRYVLAADRVATYYPKDAPPIVARCLGKDLLGRRYRPLFPYFAELAAEGAFRIIAGDFVSTESGTGIVHTAPGFGEDDARVAGQAGIPTVCPVDAECRFTAEVSDYTGRFVKDCDKDIIKRLKDEGSLVHRTQYLHDYPHCWRCDAPLISRAVATWFVKVESLKDRLLAANEQIRWVPGHIKQGRFGKWLQGARDWAISRNRYWGCPLPIWRNEETGEHLCIGSIAELEAACGHPVEDIHKHYVDGIVLTGKDGAELRRVPEVLDCWFESGSMPYAQRHYPFSNKQWLEEHFPADFIAEGLDQTRGWFYTLVVLGAALFDKPAFRNVVVNGLVLAEDGSKMSKRLRNYPPPDQVIGTYGADALRLYMLNSPIVRGDNLCFSENGVQEIFRGVILPLWNAQNFFLTYAAVDDWQPAADAPPATPANPLDRWILSRVDALVADVRAAMAEYDLQAATGRFGPFVDLLTNWYIRRSRRRFWKSTNDTDKDEAYATLWYTLVTLCRAAAPFVPFVAENVYRALRRPDMPESVHLCDFPATGVTPRDEALDRRMDRAMTAVTLGRYLRRQAEIKIRQPLATAVLVSIDPAVRADLEAMADVVAEELNVKAVAIQADEAALVHLSAKANFKRLGPRLGKQMKTAAQAIAGFDGATIQRLLAGGTVDVPLADGEALTLTAEDIDIRREEKEGMAVANEGAITVALDLHVTAELECEGQARELVRAIQDLRKERNLDVADRIRVTCDLPAELAAAVATHAEYIGAETLAVELLVGDLGDRGIAVEVGDHTGRIELERT